MSLQLHIANAAGAFSDAESAIITQASHEAEAWIASHFTFDFDVDLIVTAPSFLMNTIPEDGISGRTYSSRLVMVVVDSSQKALTVDTVFEILCHEMSHALRWEKLPEYSETLFDGMILEGLAVALEEKAMSDRDGARQFFLNEVLATSDEEIIHMIDELKGVYATKNYDYQTIFFQGSDSLPRWAGYRLGYYYVSKYLEEKNVTIEQATLDSYTEFSSLI